VTYALVATNIITILAALACVYLTLRAGSEERARTAAQTDVRERELLQRIQAPQVAVAQAQADAAITDEPISLTDDEDIVAWQEDMKRQVQHLEASTAEVVKQYETAA
jgi:hypothetical protein